eukprot:CAMPEP_0196821876 /NCGR_PEP_ID=MMETSP1362-20130617/81322_1 /TAXON_ID=163516 /ORGANISM="Leptocylindrus danicus, Strain CCMP1856" /LENGTH=270 /DNA_ID=CAMNT_0042201251 /DNA_START=168 /DNA_END=980 /DNA_ORIENTATION=-
MTTARTTGGGRGGANHHRNRSKLLYCEICQRGYSLPRGQPNPEATESSSSSNNNNNICVQCPICQFQVLKITRGDGYEGNGYHVCPRCFTDAPMEHGGNGAGDFRCFSCTNSECSLSGGGSSSSSGVEVFACPFCLGRNKQGSISLRKNARGFVLSCSNYSSVDKCQYTIWLPKEASNVEVHDANNNEESSSSTSQQQSLRCRRCPNAPRKLVFTWKSGSVPPHFDRVHVCCVLCDALLKEDMGLKLPSLNQVRIHGRSYNAGRGRGGRR